MAALRAATRQALHAAELYFVHPTLDARVTFEAPLPEDFEGWLSALREDRDS
jgi:23S rRNA pseudouridine1911/1915/1917 synthase